jgi:mycoketide-CoA synthase
MLVLNARISFRPRGSGQISDVSADRAVLRANAAAVALPRMFIGLIASRKWWQVDDSFAVTESRFIVAKRLSCLPDDEQDEVLLELVRSHMATVLGLRNTRAIGAGRAFRDQGFDSLTALELRNRLEGARGLGLSPTLIFDHPTPRATAAYLTATSRWS